MKKKILLVTDVYGWGGHVRAQYIKKHLSDEFDFDIVDGIEFSKYSLNNDSGVFTQDEFELFQSFSGKKKKEYKISEFVEFCENKKSIKDYDLIYLLFHTMLLRKDVNVFLNKGIKILTIVTAFPVLRAGFKNQGKNAKNVFLERANKCVGVIANNYISLEDLKNIYNGKTFYAPRGVDPEVFYPTKEFTQKPEEEFTVAFCGKAENKEKGFLEIIKPACIEAGVKLIDNQRIFNDALTPEEMREFYNKADAYLVASIMDGTPNTALEAAACGLPLVSNKIGNMPDLIIDHKNGWLLEEREKNKYVHRLNWMKKNQKTAWEIGQKGRKAVLEDWTWNSVLNNNERLIFREILNEI